jgi:hypothetical protein
MGKIPASPYTSLSIPKNLPYGSTRPCRSDGALFMTLTFDFALYFCYPVGQILPVYGCAALASVSVKFGTDKGIAQLSQEHPNCAQAVRNTASKGRITKLTMVAVTSLVDVEFLMCKQSKTGRKRHSATFPFWQFSIRGASQHIAVSVFQHIEPFF